MDMRFDCAVRKTNRTVFITVVGNTFRGISLDIGVNVTNMVFFKSLFRSGRQYFSFYQPSIKTSV